MGKSSISMAMFNSYVRLPEGSCQIRDRTLKEVDESYLPSHDMCVCVLLSLFLMVKGCQMQSLKCDFLMPVAGQSWREFMNSIGIP
jgi:hypothetical protein